MSGEPPKNGSAQITPNSGEINQTVVASVSGWLSENKL
jgi:hypothetical protein